MLRFFSKMRYKLATENRAVKYLRYAIGEILLVVLGILIALNVNNWNANRKRKALEIKTYKEIRNDLFLTAREVKNDRDAHIFMLKSTDSLITHLVHAMPNNEHIVQWMINAVQDMQVYPKTSGFDALNSIGLDLLSNDTVRSAITNLYQLQLERIVQLGKRENTVYSFQESLGPFLSTYFIPDTAIHWTEQINIDSVQTVTITRYGTKINNYPKLINDSKLIQELNRAQIMRNDLIIRHNLVYKRILNVVDIIDKELIRLE